MHPEQDEDKLFAEISNALAADDHSKLSELTKEPAQPEPEVPEQPEQPEQPEEPEAPEQPEEEPGDGNSPQEPEPPADKDAEPEVPDPKNEPDELEKLRETIKKLEKDNHNLRSQAGRVPHVQRRIRELDKKLEELTKQQASPSSRPSDKIKERLNEVLKGVKETDEELAETIAKAVAAATDTVSDEAFNRQLETLKLIREQEAQAYHQSEVNRLLEMYPNAGEVVRSEHWSKWKSNQSDRMRALAESDNADDVAIAFERYAADMKRQFPDLAKEEPAAQPAKNGQAEKIEQERKARKATAAAISSPAAPAKVQVPDDPEALFAKFYGEIDKRIRGT